MRLRAFTPGLTSVTVADTVPTMETEGAGVPRQVRIELGCGGAVHTGFLGLDRLPLPGVAVVGDLDRPPLPLRDDCADLIPALQPLLGLEKPIVDEAGRPEEDREEQVHRSRGVVDLAEGDRVGGRDGDREP